MDRERSKWSPSTLPNGNLPYGTSRGSCVPITEETASLETIKELLELQPGIIKERYSDRMEETFPAKEMGMDTIELVLIRTTFHEGLHLQKVMGIRHQLSNTIRKHA
ncbi:hypothetical protein [Sediminibacillus halophilus]|uniref:hypothetical protein n=1 Tax=Sediminibacillus halophilus TaxID=482461 RepID=UPI000944ABDD|nr:hypothetical protein [Sediminibacillus halophilus]